jgi:hypothetical protein
MAFVGALLMAESDKVAKVGRLEAKDGKLLFVSVES